MGKWQVGSLSYHPALLSIWHLQMSFGGALVFCAYLVFDTWRISEQMEVDDYIEGAIQLYMDIVPWPIPHPPSTIFWAETRWTSEGDETCEGCKTLSSKVTDVLCKEKRCFFEDIFPLKWLLVWWIYFSFRMWLEDGPFPFEFFGPFSGTRCQLHWGYLLFFWERVFWVQFGGAKVHLCFKVKIFQKKAYTTQQDPLMAGPNRFVKLESIQNVSVQEGIGCHFFGGEAGDSYKFTIAGWFSWLLTFWVTPQQLAPEYQWLSTLYI